MSHQFSLATIEQAKSWQRPQRGKKSGPSNTGGRHKDNASTTEGLVMSIILAQV